jgi:hypothetical protein
MNNENKGWNNLHVISPYSFVIRDYLEMNTTMEMGLRLTRKQTACFKSEVCKGVFF